MKVFSHYFKTILLEFYLRCKNSSLFLYFINQMKELLASDEDDDTKSSKTDKGYVPKLIGKRGQSLKAA